MDISLAPMTKALCRAYMAGFVQDIALFADPEKFQPYVYREAECDAYFERHRSLGRIHFAIMHRDNPIGEIILKKIDRDHKHCTLGICMQRDEWKNRGFGTQAERLALQYAFDTLGLDAVFADSLLGNKRSQHVLEKVGFQKISQDQDFIYYRCDRADWNV